MKYAVEMIFIPSFIKFGSGIQKLTGRGVVHRNTDSMVIS
jgi:hypothetical protein